MTAELVIAGFSSLALAAGHTWIGLRWVLPHLDKGRLPRTPFGPSSLTLGMVRFCWQIISVLLPWFGVLFLALAWTHVDPRTLILRLGGVFWLAATGISMWNARRRPARLLRFPVPAFMALIAAMCWLASS